MVSDGTALNDWFQLKSQKETDFLDISNRGESCPV